MKKFLSVVLAVLMCVLPLTANVPAAGLMGDADATYTFSDAAGFAGEEINVQITLKTESEFDTIGINNIKYDPDFLTFVKWTIDSDLKDAAMLQNFNKNKMTAVVGLDPEYPMESYDALVGTLTFKINENAPVGETSVYLANAEDAQLKRGSNLLDVETVPSTVTVKGLDFPEMTFKDKAVTYNSEVQNILVTGAPDFATVKYTVDGDEFTGAEDAGIYDIVATVTAPGYNKETLEATLTINKKDLVINANVPGKVYDGTTTIENFADYITLDGVVEGDNVSIDYTNTNLTYFAEHVGTWTLAGNGVAVRGSDLPNYNRVDAWKEAKATITPKPITVKADDITIKLGAEIPTLTYTAEGLVEGDTLLGITLTTTAKNNVVKNYPITVKSNSNYDKNYKITTVNGTFYVIDKTAQEVNVPEVEGTITYGDEGFNLGVTLGEVVNDSAVAYESLTPAVVSVDAQGNVTIVGAGTAKIAVTKAGDAEYADFEKTVTFTVAKKGLVVTAKDVTVMKTVGKIPAKEDLEYDVEGLVNGDEKADVFTGALTTTAKNSNTVKTYPITQGTLKANSNYVIQFNAGVLSVVDKTLQDITVTSNAPSSITYGDEGFKIDVAYGETVTDAETTFVSSDDEVVKVDVEGNVTIVGAGTAKITVSKAGNDTIADFVEEIEVVVAKREITVNAEAASKKVGNADPALSYSYVGELVGDDDFTGDIAREEGEEVGSYKITIGTLTLGDNYKIIFNGATFTIFDKTPQNITVETTIYEKTYGDEPFDLDVTYGENVSDETTTFASNNEEVATVDANGKVTIVGAGTAKITVARLGDEDLAAFSKEVTVTVAKREIKVIANAREKYVGQETPKLTYTYEGELVGDDAFTGELTVNDLNKAGGKYDIKVGTLSLGNNYKVTFEGAKLSVLKKFDQDITLGELEIAVYGGEGQTLEITYGEYNTEADVVVTSSDESVATIDEDNNITIVGAGVVEFTVEVEGNYKYNAFSDSVDLVVDRRDLDFVIYDQVKKINTADPEFTYSYTGLVDGDTVSGTPERKAGEALGSYDIKPGTLTVSCPENYNIGFTWGTLTIVDKNPQVVEVTGIPENATYGDDGFDIVATSESISDTAVEYTSSDENVIAVDEDGKATIVGAGEAVITVVFAGDDDFAQATVTKTVVVAAKEIAVATLDTVNKTVTFTGVLEADADAVSVDFNKLTFTPEDVEEGQTPENYVVTGFELTGDKSANYTLTTETVLVPMSDEIALVNVSAVAENGSVEGIGSYLAGSEVTVKAIPNTGYKFSAWYVGEEKVSSNAEYTFTAEADIELTAKFSKKSTGGIGGGSGTPTRTVYFKVDGENTTAVSVDKGDKVQRPEDPTLEGYTFGGWFADEELTKEYDFDKAVDTSITLYAKWTAVETEPDDGEDKPDDGEGKTEEWKNPYIDVKDSDWFYGVVKSATEAGIMNGVSENTFAPNALVTRAMLVTMLYRAEGMPTTEGNSKFEDIAEGSYYAEAVAWAAENGIVLGISETEFAPDANVTREQIATIIFRYAGYKGVEAIELSENLFFDDADKISEYAVAPMNWLVGKEIITGYEDGTVRPQGNATRAEVAAITARILTYLAQ